MTQRFVMGTIPIGLAVLLVVASVLTPLASADDQIPGPNIPAADRAPDAESGWADAARQTQNSAEWSIGEMTFQSNYPNGFTFTVEASSSGGAIASARVEWTHRANRPGEPKQVIRETGTVDPGTGLITAVWAPEQSSAVPPWVGVNYQWRLRDEAGNEFLTEPAFAEYEDHSKAWDRHESDEVIVFSSGLQDNIGELVVDAMDRQRQKYLDGWGALLPYRPRVILFGSLDDWLEWQIGHQDTTGLGTITVGLTSDVWGGTVQVLFGSLDDLAYGIVVHEVEHLYQYEFLSRRVAFTPGWFREGDATFYQMDESTLNYAMNYVDYMVSTNTLPLLLQGHGPSVGGDDALDGYYVGYTFFKWIDEKYGIEMHRHIMELMAQDLPFTEIFEQALGMSITEIESAWRIWLGASPDAPTLAPTWTPPPIWNGLPTATPFVFGK